MFIRPGTPVELVKPDNDSADSKREVGVVVHCWFNYQIDEEDCYVAFFGASFPYGSEPDPPYILRYASSVLRTLSFDEYLRDPEQAI